MYSANALQRLWCVAAVLLPCMGAASAEELSSPPATALRDVEDVFAGDTPGSASEEPGTVQPTSFVASAAAYQSGGRVPIVGSLLNPPPGALFVSDHEFDDFVEPITNPVFFEDPRSRTRIRFLMINQMIPENSILAGGDFQVYAMQATVAVNERLTILAQKDGFITLQADALPNADGWADLATGFKYVLVRDPCRRLLVSGGILYEWSQGSRDVFQGNGDGVWNFFVTAGKAIGRGHLVTAAGWHLPNNGAQESQSLFYSLHLDYPLTQALYALWELNGIHYTESGRRLPGVNVEGGDLINLGAGDVAGNDFVSMAIGLMWKLGPHMELGGAWEFPVTGREDLFDNRATLILSLIR